MAVTKEQVVEYLKSAPLMEVADLVKTLEEEFGVSAAAPVAVAAAPGAAAAAGEAAEEKTEFNVLLKGAGDKKIQVIKAVRAHTTLGLKEAKDLVDGADSEAKTVKEGVSKEEAEKIKKEFEDAGATIEIK